MPRKIEYYVIAMKSRAKENTFFYAIVEENSIVTDDFSQAVKFKDYFEAKKVIKKMKLNKNGINCEVLSNVDLSFKGIVKQIKDSDKIYCILDEDTKEWATFDSELKQYTFTKEPHRASTWSKADGQGLVDNKEVVFQNKNVKLYLYEQTIN